MQKVFKLAVLAVLSVSFLPGDALARVRSGCADHGVKPIQEKAHVSLTSKACDEGFTVSVDGHSITSDPDAGCPEWTTTTAAYHVGDPSNTMPGYEPYALGKVYEMKQEYACVACGYLLLSTCCEHDGAPYAIGNGYDDWDVRKCVEDVPVPGGN